MSEPMNNHDLVDQAVAQILESPLPQGPSAMVIERTVQALNNAEQTTRQRILIRLLERRWIYKVAAVLVIGIFGVALMMLVKGVGGGSVAFGEVAKKLRQTRTLSCRWTMDMPAIGKPVSMKMIFMEPGRLRVEAPGAVVTILDSSKDKMLVLNPVLKMATEIDIASGKGPYVADQAGEMIEWVEKIRNVREQDPQRIGSKTIDGREAQGFLLKEKGEEYTVWADAKSGLPLRIEIPLDLPSLKTTAVMSELEFDQKQDEKLFDLEPPAGYAKMKLSLPIPQSAPGEDDVVELLRWYAAHSNGEFPKVLDRWGDYIKLGQKSGLKPNQQEVIGLMIHAGRSSAFVGGLGRENFGYVGTAAKLGEKEKILFWYRVEGTDKYRAIFGDLHGEDVSRQRIPTSN